MRPIFALENQRSLTLSLTNIAALIRSGDSSITLRKPRTFYIPMAGCALHRVTSSRRPADYKGCGHSNHSYSEFSSHHQCGFFVSRGEGSGFKKFKKFKKFKGARGEGFNFQFSIFPLGASGAGTIVCCTSNYSLSSQRLQFVFRRGIRALCHQVGMSNLECQMSNRRAQPILTSLTFVTTRPFESKLSWRSLLQKFNFQFPSPFDIAKVRHSHCGVTNGLAIIFQKSA